jgi:hypothetical protein
MSVIFVEGFDHQNTNSDLATGDDWSTAVNGLTISASYARFLGKGLGFITPSGFPQLAKLFPSNYSQMIVGFAYNSLTNDDVNPIAIRFSSGGTAGNEQISVTVNWQAEGQINVYKGNAGGTLLGSVTGIPNIGGVWCYVEIQVNINASTGSVIIRINGNQVLSLTNVDTDPQSTGNFNLLSFNQAAAGASFYIDDIYCIDPTSGGAPWNAFLGTINGVTVETLFPASNAGTQNFTPSPNTNANWQNVSETAMDSDTTYNYDPTNGDKDLFNIGSLSSNPVNIWTMAVRAAARIDASSTVNLENRIVSNGTEVDGSAVDLGSTYAYQTTIQETDPNTSAAWTEAGVNAAQIGYKISSL